jgi:predicted enzyme related to lactoylglutathione lyase
LISIFRRARSSSSVTLSLHFIRPAVIQAKGVAFNHAPESKLDRLKCGRHDFFTRSNGETDMVNSHGRFVWYELMTTDIESAKAFYANVVGWGTRDAAMPGLAYSLFTVGDTPVTGLMNLPEDMRRTGATPHWIGYVGVDNVDAAVDRIKQLGGAVQVPPTDVPNISRFSVVVDPQMATLTLVQGLAADWEKAFAFYGELFGWQKADADIGPMGTYQLFSVEGQTIGGMFTKPPMVPVPFWLYYFSIGDIDAAAERVKAGGGQILEGPLEVPGGSWIARCTDPQGAIFALEGNRSHKAIGNFERVVSRDPSDARCGRWYWWINRN